MINCVTRAEDMSTDGRLRIMQQDDGDMIVVIVPASQERRRSESVEFCSVGCGGGRSPHTVKALRDLMTAMRKDNEERKIDNSGEGVV
jgi:hypothetical protein